MDIKDKTKDTRPVSIPGFESSPGKYLEAGAPVGSAAAAQKSVGYSQSSDNAAFGGKVYKLGKNRQNVDEYSPIYNPEFFGDDAITGCDLKTYGLILLAVAAGSVALPGTIIGLALAFDSTP